MHNADFKKSVNDQREATQSDENGGMWREPGERTREQRRHYGS